MSGGNDGALFQNKNKERGDRRPHYTGNIVVDGVKYSLAGWKNRADSGIPYVSLKLSEWREKGERSAPTPPPQEEFDDDIPF